MSRERSVAIDQRLPKAGRATRLAKRLGLSKLRTKLIRQQIEQRFPSTPVAEAGMKHIAVFPRIGVVYNRIQKNANTATMLLLDSLEVGRMRSIAQSKGQHLIFYNAWLRGACRLGDARYLVIGRSPFTRALSSFLFVFQVRQHATIERFGRSFPITPQGFEEFLRWLKDEALSGDQHWDLQTRSLALPIQAFTDIIRMEHYEQEMRGFLNRIGQANAAAEMDFAAIRKLGSPHATRDHVQRKDFLTPATRRLIAEIYAEDFTAFGYDPDESHN